jgi:ribosomal protein S18 acetylase RimI-like enzyme
MSAVRVRLGRPEDCAGVATMVQDLARIANVEAGVTGEILAREAFGPRPTIALLVAEDEWQLLGCLVHQDTFSTWRGANGVFVVDLFVREGQRGRGIGLDLMRAAARLGIDRGARFMRLDVEPDNVGAIRFYRRLGFRPVDHRFEMMEAAGMIRLAEPGS